MAVAKILYIEDHAAQRDILAQMLAFHGFEVEVAGDGLEGVGKAIAWQPDLILVDMRMPRLSGLEAIRRIRNLEQFAEIPIIGLSAWIEGPQRDRVLEAGANEHFTKPIYLDQLLPVIKAYLGKTPSK
jgi:CheY-like chemotaxis protein